MGNLPKKMWVQKRERRYMIVNHVNPPTPISDLTDPKKKSNMANKDDNKVNGNVELKI